MSEPQEDPRIREAEPSTERGGPLDPTTSSLSEMTSAGVTEAGQRDVEEVTDSGDAGDGDTERGEPA